MGLCGVLQGFHENFRVFPCIVEIETGAWQTGGLARKVPTGPKRAFFGAISAPPRRCEVRKNRPRKGPDTHRKGPISPKTARFSRKDFHPRSSLKNRCLSPRL